MTVKPSDTILSLEDIAFRYPGASQDTLNVARLHVQAADRILIQGDSGCGKSTLLSLSAGVILPHRGTVCLLGKNWQTLSPAARDAWRVDHVGYIFQQFNLLPYLSVLENVLMPCRFSSLRAQRARQLHGSEVHAAQTLLAALGLNKAQWPAKATTLSVGQQQRVAAARALIGCPELVIADEPTSALDEGWRDSFMQLLIQQCENNRSALLFVTHDARLSCHFHTVVKLPFIDSASNDRFSEVS